MMIKKFSDKSYAKLLDYVIEKSDYIKLTQYVSKFRHVRKKHIPLIFSNIKYTKKEVLENYSKKLLNEIYDELKCNKQIYEDSEEEYLRRELPIWETVIKNIDDYNFFEMQKEELKKEYSKNPVEFCLEIRKSTVFIAIQYLIYKENIKKFLKKYKNSLLSEEKFFFENKIDVIIYKFSLSEEIKEDIRNKKKYKFPDGLEDLTFVKNNIEWFLNIDHEYIYDIYCENEEEYNYLKSIGVEFYEDHYIPEKPILENEV